MKVDTVIFDIGGVLIGYDWDAYLMKLFNDDRGLVNTLEDALFNHGVWNELDRGVWSEEELLEGFYKYAPDKKTELKKFYDTAGDALWQFDFTKQLIKDLKAKGCRVLYLSNWSEHLKELAAKQLDFLPLMDGGIFSCDVKLIKPDHKIYETILDKYNLRPEQCVFLDDKLANVEAARECGLHGIQIVDHVNDHKELFELISKSE